MFNWIKKRLKKRREVRARCKSDAEKLASSDPVNAYYIAQRTAARFRCSGEADEFMYWATVAAEIARIEPRAEMDFAVLKAINDEEDARRNQSQIPPHQSRGL